MVYRQVDCYSILLRRPTFASDILKFSIGHLTLIHPDTAEFYQSAHTKFEKSSFVHSKDMSGDLKFRNVSRDPDAHFVSII